MFCAYKNCSLQYTVRELAVKNDFVVDVEIPYYMRFP